MTRDGHVLRHEIGEVRYIGVRHKSQVEQHVAEQVLYRTFRRNGGLHRFGGQALYLHARFLACIHEQGGIRFHRELAEHVRHRLVRRHTFVEHYVRQDMR